MRRHSSGQSRWSVEDCAGICLAELMIALAAGAIVLSAAVQSLSHFGSRLSIQQDIVEHDQDLRIGLMVMVEELQRAMIAPSGAKVTTMGREDIVFLANMDGMTANLTEGASIGQQELKVTRGTGWTKGKRVMLCDHEQCYEWRLARDGQKTALQLTTPLERGFPQGSPVWLVSQIRYYLGTDQLGRSTLMRQIDGGTNPLIGDLTELRFRYLDKRGRPAEDSSPSRIYVEARGRNARHLVTREVSLGIL